MNRQEAIIKKRVVIGVLHVAEWGVTFDPTEQSPLFNQAKLKTWETVEAARAEIMGELQSGGRQGG
jgi:hypothetical protein